MVLGLGFREGLGFMLGAWSLELRKFSLEVHVATEKRGKTETETGRERDSETARQRDRQRDREIDRCIK